MSVPAPKWIDAYLVGGNNAVEALPEYKGSYCFVIAEDSTNKNFLLTWVGNVDGPRQIAALIATTVETNVQAKSSGAEGSGIENAVTATTETMSNASYTGVRKMADWWRFIRTRTTKDERYQAYVLYTGERKSINDQIVRNLQNIVATTRQCLPQNGPFTVTSWTTSAETGCLISPTASPRPTAARRIRTCGSRSP
jgi:hypothetical protein